MDSKSAPVECVRSVYAMGPTSPASGSHGTRQERGGRVAAVFSRGARAVVTKNHGVAAAGRSIHHARAIDEALGEWAKVLTMAKMLGWPAV